MFENEAARHRVVLPLVWSPEAAATSSLSGTARSTSAARPYLLRPTLISTTLCHLLPLRLAPGGPTRLTEC